MILNIYMKLKLVDGIHFHTTKLCKMSDIIKIENHAIREKRNDKIQNDLI